jgi:hypothetical protein
MQPLYVVLDLALELDLMGWHECEPVQELDLENLSGFFYKV